VSRAQVPNYSFKGNKNACIFVPLTQALDLMEARAKLPMPLQLALVVAIFALLVATAQFVFMLREMAAIGSVTGDFSSALGAQILFPLAGRPLMALFAASNIYCLIYRPTKTASRLSLALLAGLVAILVWSAINWFTGDGTASYFQTSDVGRIVYPAVRLGTISLLVTLALFIRPYAID